MKTLPALLGILLFPGLVRASALASIYNGNQFQLEGQMIVQDSDHTDRYFLIPKSYHIKRITVIDNQTGENVNRADLDHEVITVDGNRFSSYTMRVVLDTPSQLESLRAQALLRQKMGQNARLMGVAPICGIRLGGPSLDHAPEASRATIANPNATLIQYSISATEAAKCTSILDTTEFNLEYRVPIALEPKTAKTITSNVGIVLPAVELILPLKYKDRVSVSIDAESAIHQLKAGANLKGSFEYVSAGVKASIEHLLNTLQVSGQVTVDCQNPDKTICDGFIEQAKDILAKTLYILSPETAKGDTNPIVMADNDKASDASLFKADLAYDEQSAKRAVNFKVDFSNTVYSSIYSQAQIRVSSVPIENLDPAVQKMMKSRNDNSVRF